MSPNESAIPACSLQISGAVKIAIKKGKKRSGKVRRQKSRVGKVSDPDAGWCVKKNTEGTKKYVFGYKIHILADAKYELPMVVDISPGNMRTRNNP